MRDDEVRALYSGEYAERYEAIWHHDAEWADEARAYAQIISGLLGAHDRWLDVGCGTGWLFSQVPAHEAAGLDFSPDMLAIARRRNPEVLLVEADMREPRPEWSGRWDLVTSFGQAWSYVERIEAFPPIVANFADWTAPDGLLVVQVRDLTDLRGLDLQQDFDGSGLPPGNQAINAVVWTLFDEVGRRHENVIWPSLDNWVRWLGVHFERVDIHTVPASDPDLPIAPRYLVASQKRPEPVPGAVPVVTDHTLSSAPAPEPAPEPADDGSPHPPPVPILDRPVRAVLGKLTPWRREFWAAVGRRVRRSGSPGR